MNKNYVSGPFLALLKKRSGLDSFLLYQQKINNSDKDGQGKMHNDERC